MFPASAERVPEHTAHHLNEKIKMQTEANIRRFASSSDQAIDWRLKELDKEWDIERVLEANAATLALTGVVLGAKVSKKWLLLPAAVTGFLIQHALQGWCPPVPILRRLGFRTRSEIDKEKYALKALRGDFQKVPQDRGESSIRIEEAMNAVLH